MFGLSLVPVSQVGHRAGEAMTTFSSLEKEDPPEIGPWWMYKPTFVNPTDGLAHRVIAVRGMGPVVHDEYTVQHEPYTRCGSLLTVFVEDNVRSCFRGADVPLTCVACASDLVLDGDRLRQHQKYALFGALYGKRLQ